MSLASSKTIENLKAAFAGESQANRKYLAFAKKAESDGFPQVAKLFRAAAEAGSREYKCLPAKFDPRPVLRNTNPQKDRRN